MLKAYINIGSPCWFKLRGKTRSCDRHASERQQVYHARVYNPYYRISKMPELGPLETKIVTFRDVHEARFTNRPKEDYQHPLVNIIDIYCGPSM